MKQSNLILESLIEEHCKHAEDMQDTTPPIKGTTEQTNVIKESNELNYKATNKKKDLHKKRGWDNGAWLGYYG